MPPTLPNIDTSVRKHCLNKDLGLHALVKSSHLSATLENPFTSYLERQQQADAAAIGWTAVHASVGLFADEHSAL